jgi:phage tail sheath protein FI
MPPALTFPGVYIEEVQSAIHTITGVATSIAAFVGWTAQGPTNRASLVQSWPDFQRKCGGLNAHSYLGYAVNHFFANGGQQAYIVRLVASDVAVASATVDGTVKVWASSPGAWGNDLQVRVQTSTDGKRFSLTVQGAANSTPVVVESFFNLSTDPADARYVVRMIDSDSDFITFLDPTTGTPPVSVGPLSDADLKGGSDGTILDPEDKSGKFEKALNSDPTGTGGVHFLDPVDFNLLCVPGESDPATIQNLQRYCHDKRAFYIVDSPQSFKTSDSPDSKITDQHSINSALYFPWVLAPDALVGNRPRLFPSSGFIAGIYANTDASRGVWKAPAGIDASLTGVIGLQYVLTDIENGSLNVKGVNCLREFKTYGNVSWGARTLRGSDETGSEWKYVPIRRLALFLESSLYNGTKWAVFEPNDERLWGQIRLNVGAFMQGLFLQGAFQGTTPQQAYFVKCDAESNPQSSINLGIVNITVGFAAVYPAEFVVIQIQQMAGQAGV